MRPLLRVTLAAGGVFLFCLLATTACIVVSTHGVDLSFNSSDWPEKAERTDTRELKLVSGQSLRAVSPDGAIRVRATQGGTASLRALVRAAGRTQAEAQALLERTSVVVEESTRGVTLRLEVRKDETDEQRRPDPAVDFEIEVPADVALDLSTRSGSIQAEGGPFGPARLESSYGSVQIENVRGDVTATSKSGKVDVTGVTSGSVEATSGYGAVSVKDVDAGSVTLRSSSGQVQIARVRGKNVTAESGYGAVSVRDVDVEREIEARSKSGNVTAESLKGARIQLSSGYGAIRVKGAQGQMSLETSSGNISVDDVESALTARTGYGSISVDGVLTDLDLSSSSGSIKAHARTGSRVDAEWSLKSGYGRVELRAPKDMACDLSAKTGYGQIDVGYAMEVAPGALTKSGRDVQGRINGGGKSLRMQSSSGNVVLAPSGD